MYTALLLALTPGGAALARTPSPNENNNTIPGTSLAHAAFEIALGSDAQLIERGRYSRPGRRRCPSEVHEARGMRKLASNVVY